MVDRDYCLEHLVDFYLNNRLKQIEIMFYIYHM